MKLQKTLNISLTLIAIASSILFMYGCMNYAIADDLSRGQGIIDYIQNGIIDIQIFINDGKITGYQLLDHLTMKPIDPNFRYFLSQNSIYAATTAFIGSLTGLLALNFRKLFN
jgi:hypothetical protein